jgi:hypothetical protein
MRRTGRLTTWTPRRTERVRRSRSSLRLRAHTAGGVGFGGARTAAEPYRSTGLRTSRAGSGPQFFLSNLVAATSNWVRRPESGRSWLISLPSVLAEDARDLRAPLWEARIRRARDALSTAVPAQPRTASTRGNTPWAPDRNSSREATARVQPVSVMSSTSRTGPAAACSASRRGGGTTIAPCSARSR